MIIHVSPEAVPLAKTGGLADVCGVLPRVLSDLGKKVSLILPLYREVRHKELKMSPLGLTVRVQLGDTIEEGAVWKSELPESSVPVFFIEQDGFFDRDGLYGNSKGDYPDNARRFVFFCRAALEAIASLGLAPRLVHCHDWQTALIPVYLKTLYRSVPAFSKTRCVMTIHNLAYQGVFARDAMGLTGLPPALFHWKHLEFWGKLNFLKGGLVFADKVTTVSEGYAREIQTPEFGCGLEGVLRDREKDLVGIPNGIDEKVWNPRSDPLIPARYSGRDLRGKKRCKEHVLDRIGLPSQDGPMAGMVTRLAEQKGVELLLEGWQRLLELGVQLVVLGTGQKKYEAALRELAEKSRQQARVLLSFDEGLSHEIQAGADLFLMPSRYEPCGLNQLYSLRYGTVPVVRRTGGLADTVVDFSPEGLVAGTATGFVFDGFRVEDFVAAVERSVRLYRTEPDNWRRLQQNGMKQDWSWTRSARRYGELYKSLG